MGDVDHVYQDVGLAHLVEGGLERLDEAGGELADETDGVGEQEGEVVDYDLAHGGVEGGEKLVFGEHLAFAEEVHQRGLTHVGISNQGHAGEFAAVLALDRLLFVDGAELLLEPGDFVEDYAAVGLDLRFTGAAHADTAALAFEVGPQARQARQQVLVLGQFDLGFGVGCLGAAREDVENQRGAVENLYLELLLDV